MRSPAARVARTWTVATSHAATLLALAGCMAIAVAGCGSSSDGARSARTTVADNTTIAAPAATDGSHSVRGAPAENGTASARRPGVTARSSSAVLMAEHARSHAFFARANKPGASEDATPSHANILNPCSLVSRAEAESALGLRSLQARVAPLGPSCVFVATNHKAVLSVVVNPASFAALRSQMSDLRKFSGVGWKGLCGGTRGASSLYARVNATEVLHLTGPCLSVAKLVPTALARLRHTKAVVPTQPS